MAHPSLYANLTVRAFIGNQKFTNLLEYLITHNYLFMDDLASAQVINSRTLLESTLSGVYERLVGAGIENTVSFVRPKPREDQLPELLTIRSLTLDMEQAKDVITPALAGAMIAQPHMYDKLLLNITPYIQSTGQLTDAIGFQSAIVRDALSRSYYNDSKTAWISPVFTQFVSRVYSMTMGTSVSQWYRLDVKTLNILVFFFAYFYLIKMSDVRAAKATLASQWRKFMIPDPSEQGGLYGVIESTLPHGREDGLTTLHDVIAVIHALNIPRLQLDMGMLTNRLRTAFSQDVLTTALCLDYPPMLALLIIQSLSGVPVGLNYKLKSLGFVKNRSEFEDELLRSHALYDSLNLQ